MEAARDSTSFLGVHIAERVLSKIFEHVNRMPYGNPGFDFVCGKGFKIDVKSSCLNICTDRRLWDFSIKRNDIADYFLFLAFDNRHNLTPMHVWLIPGSNINQKIKVSITNSKKSLCKWSEYERPLDRVIACCDAMRE